MSDPTQELMLEILRKIQADIADIKRKQDEHGAQFVRVRESIHSLQGEIHSLHGDVLRIDRSLAGFQNQLDRINKPTGTVGRTGVPRLAHCFPVPWPGRG